MNRQKEGVRFLLDFLKEIYLDDYIAKGGSKTKFITGRAGSGKTFFLDQMKRDAEAAGYITVSFSAKKVWLHDFRNIYLEILNQVNMEQRINDCADVIIRNMDYSPEEVHQSRNFIDYLASKNEANILNKRALRGEITNMFLQNPLLDTNFASVCAQLTADRLGHPSLDEGDRTLLYQWLMGDSTMKFTVLRALGLSPVRITKYNARHMLRSLSEVIRLGGHSGLIIFIDDLDILCDNSGMEEIHYGKVRRDDAYESIRQIIDDIDTMRSLMFVFAFDRTLVDNEKAGIKSYQALWMRIQNEVLSERFNCFSDILDLDRLASQVYSDDYIMEMSLEFAEEAEKKSKEASIIDEQTISEILEKAKYGSVGLPQLIKEATLEGKKS